MTLEEDAIALLLRSPRLEVGTIMELLDVGDRDFREMAERNAKISELLEARRTGSLEPASTEPKQCPVCDEWFIPYASERCCSDACKKAQRATRSRRQPH